VKRAALLASMAALFTTATACRQIAGIQDLPQPCGDPLMIDDMEDADGAICDTPRSGMRHGDWFAVSYGADQSPPTGEEFLPTAIPGGRNGSRYAARATGSAVTNGAARAPLMGFNLNVQGLEVKPYSASTVGGIRFWMKSNVAVSVQFLVAETMLRSTSGGSCMDTATIRNCNNHFQYLISHPDPGKWIEFDVPFAALAQGTPDDEHGNTLYGSAVWDPSVLVGIQFAVGPQSQSVAVPFDVWVDDIQFYACSDIDCRPSCPDADYPNSCPAVGDVPASCWPDSTIYVPDCSNAPALANHFVGAWGSGPNDVWTVGGSDVKRAATLMHWTRDWAAVPAGNAPGLRGVWGSAPNDVWAVGDAGTTLHWDGATWTSVATGTIEGLRSVWASGPNDVWAVGHGGTILHGDGATWSLDVASPETKLWLSSVSGSGPDDVWAAGISELELEPTIGLLVHWNGRNWSSSYGVLQPVWGVWSNGRSDAWAVGRGIFHWDGSGWRDVPSPIDTTHDILTSVWGSAADDVWAVGTSGTILHWDGTDWSSVQLDFPVPADLYGIWGSGPDNVWAVGARGTILWWRGTTWDLLRR
jgi:hypothetical protein